MPVAGALPDYAEAALTRQVSRPPHHLGRALALAAIRETYEETGLLLGTAEYGPPEDVPEGWEAFQRHLQDYAPWGATVEVELDEQGWGFAADASGPVSARTAAELDAVRVRGTAGVAVVSGGVA